MTTLPDLDPLSHAEKDELIRALFTQVVALTKQVERLTAKVAELEGRLAQNSRNSSKPPSSDGLNRPKPKSQRKAGQNPSGGQKGHQGHTLKKTDDPDHIKLHAPPDHCDACGGTLTNAIVVEARQVFDIPPLRHEVTEHQVLEAVCSCGKAHRGKFPVGVSAPVQYGPRLKAAVVHLTHHHMMPVSRTGDLMGDLFGLPLSDATVLAINAEAGAMLAPTVTAMGETLKTTPVVHADETGMKVAGKLLWLHVLATTLMTWIGCHANRGKKAFDSFGILGEFVGTLIHDGWKPYRDLACIHALCNAHHLRELTYAFEEMGQVWANRMIELLVAACHEVNQAGGVLTPLRLVFYRTEYDAILTAGEAANPRAPPSGKRGRTKQSKALNLIDRLRDHADDVWRFAIDHNVPFSNNIAEQAVRMPKVKQKISGGFRTKAGLDTFCTIRSYLATLHKQHINLFQALTQAFQGSVPQPLFA
ncbi:MAG: IS66 family transposase [Gammaproteobacteria bacterium]|nr:IS66 family transposase [Gammaproteobacteria bacterium]